jgi:hypothetical protein
MAPSALQKKWSKGDKLGVAIDMARHVAFFALNDGEWVEVPLPKEEKRFFPALSGRFSGGELRLSIGERGDDGWSKLKPPPGTGPYRAIKDAATGNTPALAAAASGHITVARALLKRDASVWTDVEREHRWTLLHASARWNDKALMEEALKRAPGSESMRDAEGLFPVELAALHQQKDVLAALLERDVQDSFATLKHLLKDFPKDFPKVLDLSKRKPPLGPQNAELLSGLLLVRGEGCHELNLSGQNLRTSGSNALAKALKVNGALTSINLSYNQLCGIWTDDYGDEQGTYTAKGITAIAHAMRVNGGLTSLDLSNNALCGVNVFGGMQYGTYTAEGITAIADALRVNGGLTVIDLSGNQLCGIWSDWEGQYGTYTAEGITAIADALRVNGGLTALDLSCNDLKDEGVSAVCEAIQSNNETKLASLNMRANCIGPVGAKSVASMVAVTGGLTSLDLFCNELCGLDHFGHGTYTAEGITAIADALRVNGALTSLNLSENRLCGLDHRGTYTAEGIIAIADALCVNGGLTSLNLSENQLCGLNAFGKGTYTAEGITAIADALRVNGALTEIE